MPLLLVLLSACAGDGDSGGDGSACDSGEPVGWVSFADGFFATYCRSCHAVGLRERYGAPEGVDFDTEAEVRAQEARIRARALTAGDMPPGGGVVEEDLALLTRYLDCGTGP